MNKKWRSRSIAGMLLNLLAGGFVIKMALTHPDWESTKLTGDEKVKYLEGLLHIAVDKEFLVAGGVMLFSAYLFWKLRKAE